MTEIVAANPWRARERGRRPTWRLVAAGAVGIGLGPALVGCHHASYHYHAHAASVSGGASQGVNVRISTGSQVAGGLIAAVLLAEGVRYHVRGPDGTFAPLERAPAPDPTRVISEQDCSRMVTLDGGNLRCR